MKNPWTKRKSKLLYQNPWIRLHLDSVIRPDSKKGKYSVVQTKGGIGVVPIDQRGNLYLVAQYRYAPNVYSLEIPKGAFDRFNSTESPLERAKLELWEETGLTAKSWQKLGTVYTLMGYSDDIVHLFLAKDLSKKKSAPEGTEDIRLVKIPLQKMESVVKHGLHLAKKKVEIYDATSIAALFMAKSALEKNDKEV